MSNIRRQELKELSNSLKKDLEEGKSLNSAIIAHYKEEYNVKQLATFNDWKDAGYSIKKGAKGLPIWGRPQPTEEDKDFFPLCYMFSENQVYKNRDRETRTHTRTEQRGETAQQQATPERQPEPPTPIENDDMPF